MTSAGRYRHRLKIVTPVDIDDGRGGYIPGPPQIITLRAEAIGLNGREAVIGQALQGVRFFQFRTRFRAGITAGQQARLDDAVDLNIRSADDPDGRRRELVILADTASTLPIGT